MKDKKALEWSCETKFKFESEKAAKKSIHRKHSSRPIAPYFCKNCHYWHVGGRVT